MLSIKQFATLLTIYSVIICRITSVENQVKLLFDVIQDINHETFTDTQINTIKLVHTKSKFTNDYLSALPILIQSVSSKLLISPNNTIGNANFAKLLDLLHIQPVTMDDLHSLFWSELDDATKLLIFASKTITQSLILTAIPSISFDKLDDYIIDTVTRIKQSPWFSENCFVFDIIQIIYEQCYAYLHKRGPILIPSFDSIRNQTVQNWSYLNELTVKHGFILWDTFKLPPFNSTMDIFERFTCHLNLNAFIVLRFLRHDGDDQEFMVELDIKILWRILCDGTWNVERIKRDNDIFRDLTDILLATIHWLHTIDNTYRAKQFLSRLCDLDRNYSMYFRQYISNVPAGPRINQIEFWRFWRQYLEGLNDE